MAASCLRLASFAESIDLILLIALTGRGMNDILHIIIHAYAVFVKFFTED
jgi:hypothetical protein